MNNEVHLKVVGLVQGTTDGNYSLLLEEVKGEKRLPILIGSYEAQAIALALEKKELKRPLTHDLLVKFIDAGNVKINNLFIHSLLEGVFHASLNITKEGKEDVINCRPSDGVVLALKYNLTIKVAKKLMDEYGIVMDDQLVYDEDITEKPGRPEKDLEPQNAKTFEELIEDFSLEQLQKMLDNAEQNEDYEKAAKIRDEIDRR